MKTHDVRGTPVDIHMAGSGPPLLYLHAEQFLDRAQPHLDALASRWRVIAPRHPGYGTEGIPPHMRTVEDIAYLYLDLIDQLSLNNVLVVGASLGGWIGLEMCVRNHNRISKLALVSSVGVKFGSREERDLADIFYLPDTSAFPLLFADHERWAPNYSAMSNEELVQYARERETMAYYCWRPYMHNPGLKHWLHRANLPALVLWGEDDRFSPPAYGRLLAARLPKGEFRLIPGVGHHPGIERSDAVVCAIEAFAKS